MRTSTWLRSSSATWMTPFLAAFVVLLLRDDLTAHPTRGYWPAVVGDATIALAFVLAVCAGSGAWEGTRVRRGKLPVLAPSRGPLRIALPLLLPVIAMGATAMATAVTVVAAVSAPGTGNVGRALLIVAVWLLLITAFSLAGFALAQVVPALIAVPVASVVGFVTSAYPPAVEPLWLRHLIGGDLTSCCLLESVPGERGVASASLVAITLIAATALLLAMRHRVAAVACAVFVTASGVLAASALVWNTGLEASTAARPDDELICSGEAPRVCLWPELAPERKKIISAVGEAHHRLTTAGLRVPATVSTSASKTPDTRVLRVRVESDYQRADIIESTVWSVVPPVPACARSGDPYPAAAVLPVMAEWLGRATRLPLPEEDSSTDDARALALKVAEEPRHVQREWFERNTSALASCHTKPVLDPAKLPGAGR
ncbi:DUF7224 domain-containing protein [Streptomyces alkaliterrae]|uniref:DUF7224 domain-containing protein n=1 Tax=Streptomyces alkaliterrae TaxID=2213162 RepID=A0A5P0YTF7_9ACTN|nr:hypothetical protein [Streptomyces alkaliterrae]MBB1255200.1 hypothetical protein [Streptomyces alkaliterrae]MBB1261545.1 hypothetical protein [Streptomyces alkaliterrae]MQS03596.1 hypothetical protein [Streptomyces alkaliterrae]